MQKAGRKLALRFRGLTVQIVLWTVLPLTLVLIGVAFTGVYSHEQAMRDLVQERDKALATTGAAQVRELLRTRVAALERLDAEQAFHHRDMGALQILLAEAGTLHGLFAEDVALLDEGGQVMVHGTGEPAWIYDEHVLPLVRAVLGREDVALTQVFDVSEGAGIFLLGIPVDDANGTTYGVLAGPVSMSSLGLGSVLNQVQAGEQGAVYVVDAAGQILAHSAAEQIPSSLADQRGVAQALQDSQPGATLTQALDGERMTLAYAPVTFADAGWRILITEPWHEVIGPVLRYSQFMPLVAVLAAVVSLITLYYGVQSIARPLQTLGQEAERVAWGDFEAIRTPVGGVQEIEDLRRTLEQMAKRIQSYQNGMHDYIAAITQGQEEERKRLARELHDDTAQALIALGQRVEMAQKALRSDPERAVERLSQARAMIAEALEEVRRFSRDLRPVYLDDLGFIPALEMLTREADQREDLSLHFAVTGEVRRLSPDLELAAYRIVQEAVNNAVQHAAASQAWVEVRFEAESLVLSMRDDGQGFEAPNLPDTLARQGHFGLMGIQERALLYGGSLSIRSAPGEGTEIEVRFP
jgi:signal transduction histidine kinase